MTEKSYFFDGTVVGDAGEAPYDSSEFASILKSVYSTDGAYILPGELNNLEVTVTAGRTVSIASGRALIYGYWYENDAAYSVTLGQNLSSYPRYDRIVVEIDVENKTQTIKAIHGSPSPVPVVPDMPECSSLYYLPLARIYLPAGFAATASYYLFDERIFANNAYHINNYAVHNYFPNGRFLVGGSSQPIVGPGSGRYVLPGAWIYIGNGSGIKLVEKFDNMEAGRGVECYYTAADGDGWQQTIITSENFTDTFTLRLLVEVTAGECSISWGGMTVRVPVTVGVQEIILRKALTGYHTLEIASQTTAARYTFSDIRLTHGYVIPKPTSLGNYIIMVSYAPVEMDRTGAPVITGLSTGGFFVSYTDYFGNDLDYEGIIVAQWAAAEIKQLIILLGGNDSGSAGGAPFITSTLDLYPDFMRVDLGGVVNDVPRYRLGITSFDYERTWDTRQEFFYITASGAGAFDASLGVVGAIL